MRWRHICSCGYQARDRDDLDDHIAAADRAVLGEEEPGADLMAR
jgi:hypothetical protein